MLAVVEGTGMTLSTKTTLDAMLNLIGNLAITIKSGILVSKLQTPIINPPGMIDGMKDIKATMNPTDIIAVMAITMALTDRMEDTMAILDPVVVISLVAMINTMTSGMEDIIVILNPMATFRLIAVTNLLTVLDIMEVEVEVVESMVLLDLELVTYWKRHAQNTPTIMQS
ncbi:hypothetical protein MMC14_000034 [Varicellaria rhodocarpa]|nr:hypothetical protein [Varicellaria rhodocarpa]